MQCLCYTTSRENLIITDVIIKITERSDDEDYVLKLPQNYKYILFRLGQHLKNRLICYRVSKTLHYSFSYSFVENPADKVYQAEVIDRYPLIDRAYAPFSPPSLPLVK